MTTIGSFEAKTHLSKLLERACAGERILITNRGKPVAMLVPPEVETERSASDVGREMLAYRDQVKRELEGIVMSNPSTSNPPTVTDRFVLDRSVTVGGLVVP